MGHTQNALADKIAKELDLPRYKGRAFLDRILETIADDIVYTGRIELKGIGTFSTTERPQQTINHPVTGQTIQVPEKKILRFRSSKAIRQRLNPEKPAPGTEKTSKNKKNSA